MIAGDKNGIGGVSRAIVASGAAIGREKVALRFPHPWKGQTSDEPINQIPKFKFINSVANCVCVSPDFGSKVAAPHKDWERLNLLYPYHKRD